MSIAKITMTGQETYLRRTNRSLFDFISLPTGIDKDNLVDNIMMECGEFEVLYSDPEFNRSAIGTWSAKHYRTFDKWITALNIEYNPLENYDRFEDYTDKGKENGNTKTTGNHTETENGTKNDTGSYSESEHVSEDIDEIIDELIDENIDHKLNSSTENTVSAYDSNTYQPENKSDTDTSEDTDRDLDRDYDRDYDRTFDRSMSGNTQNDSTSQNTTTGTNTGNEDYTKGTELVHVGRLHGNIGVTTSQQMLQSELDIARFNIINEITKIFMQELCICIYE